MTTNNNISISFSDVTYDKSGPLGSNSINSTVVTGGVKPYTVGWTASSNTALTNDLNPKKNLPCGVYKVSITDSNSVAASGSLPFPEFVGVTTSYGVPNNYGYSTAVSGASAAVTSLYGIAPANSGSVTFLSLVSGQWVENVTLMAPTPLGTTQFGNSVAIKGNYCVVGCNGYNSNKGAAFVYFYNGSTWAYQATLTAANGVAGDQFGAAVAISVDGATIVVGAPRAAQTAPSAFSGSGAAYVFKRSGTTWTAAVSLGQVTPTNGDSFGASVDIDTTSNTISVGAFAWSQTTPTVVSGCGAVYVFITSDAWATNFSQQQILTATDLTASALFGFSISLQTDKLVVGAQGSNKVYYFTRSSGVWSQISMIAQSDLFPPGTPSVSLGTSVSLSANNLIAILASNVSIGSNKLGMTFIMANQGSQLTLKKLFVPSISSTSGSRTTCIDGTTCITGVPNASSYCVTSALTPLQLQPGAVGLIPVYGNTVGSIGQTIVVGGTAPYTTSWASTNGGTTLVDQTLGSKSLLSAGTYTVTVTDSASANVSYAYIITQPPQSSAAGGGASVPGPAGPAGRDGVSITGPAGRDGKDGRDGINAAGVVVPVKLDFKVVGGFVSHAVPLLQLRGGSISAITSITGGTAPYTVSWAGPDGYTFTGQGAQTNLYSGLYTMTATDSATGKVVQAVMVPHETKPVNRNSS
jgi:hypothetical protein